MSGFTYGGFFYLALALPIPGTDKWSARVSISKFPPNEPNNVQEHIFRDSNHRYDNEDDAVQAAHVLAKALIDGTISGLDL